jgi:hypothetical protein
MKKIYLSILFIPFFCNVKAQQWMWNEIETHPKYEGWNLKLAKDNLGNFLTYRIGGCILSKYNNGGVLLWQKNFSEAVSFRKVIASPENDLYILGTFTDSLTIDSEDRVSIGEQGIFVAKLDENGSLQWLNQIGSNTEDFPGGICILNSELFVSGGTKDTTTFSNQAIPQSNFPHIFIAQFNRNIGNLDTVVFSTWLDTSATWSLDYTYDAGEITADHNSNLVLIIDPIYKIQIDTAVFQEQCSGCGSAYIIKLDTSFHFQWKQLVAAGITDKLYDLNIDSDNNIYFIYRDSWHYLDGGKIYKLSENGMIMGTYNTPFYGHFNGIDINSSDVISFTGKLERWTYSGNPPSVHFLITGEINNSLSQLWFKKDSSLQYREGDDVLYLNPNEILVSGRFIDTLILNSTLVTSAPDSDYCFLAILNTGLSSGLSDSMNPGSFFSLFPNPTTGLLNVESKTQNAELKIYNTFGSLIHQQILKSSNQQIDLSAQPKGVYFLEAGNERRKIVLN